MAHLSTKDGIFAARFRYQGKEYKKSLKTRDEATAQAAKHVIELTIHRLHTGQVQIRDGVDPGDFIVSGGTWTPRPVAPLAPAVFPATQALMDRYLAAKEGECSDSYLSSQRTHLKHLKKFLGKIAEQPCNLVTRTTLENYLRHRKKTRDGETVNREKITLTLFYRWIALQDDIPTFPFPADTLPRFKGSRERDPFKTFEEIEASLARGGLDEEQQSHAWDSLYLGPAKIAELLDVVQRNAEHRLSFLLHAIPAYTGMRRGEVLRLRWVDVDLSHDFVVARSRKQSRTRQEVTRRIDLHPELKVHLVAWKAQRPNGQFVLGNDDTWEQLGAHEANRLFWQPMRDTGWCLDNDRNYFKIGFHTYRHSFASNLAAAGVDHRIIDEFMGHQTEEMRKRYRHLFPNSLRAAINVFSLQRQPEPASAASAG